MYLSEYYIFLFTVLPQNPFFLLERFQGVRTLPHHQQSCVFDWTLSNKNTALHFLDYELIIPCLYKLS